MKTVKIVHLVSFRKIHSDNMLMQLSFFNSRYILFIVLSYFLVLVDLVTFRIFSALLSHVDFVIL